MSGPNPASEPEEYERITVHYSCGCFKKRYRVKVQTANYPEPTEIWSDSGCWRCDERADREGAAAEGAAMEAARRRRAGLRGRLRGIPSISPNPKQASMEPSKIVTISYDKQAFESLPRCLQRQAGTKENWEKIQQECEARATAREEAAEDYYNSRAGILSLKELERREREAQPRYKDSKSALQAMKQYLKSNPPLPPALSDESWKDRQAKLRRYYEIRRMRKIVMKVLAGNEASVQESERADAREVLAGVETAMAQSDAGVGHQDQDGNGIGASSKGSKTPGAARGSTHVSSAKALEEEGWVVIPTSIVESKCQDDGIESDSDYEYNGESGEEDQEEDDSDE